MPLLGQRCVIGSVTLLQRQRVAGDEGAAAKGMCPVLLTGHTKHLQHGGFAPVLGQVRGLIDCVKVWTRATAVFPVTQALLVGAIDAARGGGGFGLELAPCCPFMVDLW